jgi:putative methionine-R-sulfoxide reductase with GAF domain
LLTDKLLSAGAWMTKHEDLMEDFERTAAAGSRADEVMQHISDRLHNELVRYNWVGFYLADPADPHYLLLGPHSGVFTPHVRISVDQGLCGTAASLGKTVTVNDVSQDPRYLKGVEETKSEIIVPILMYGTVVAEFDINSFFKDTWTADETKFVEQCAALVRRCM